MADEEKIIEDNGNDNACKCGEQLGTPVAPPTIDIQEIENDPPLCGRGYGGKLEDTALTKRQERELADAKVKAMLKDTAPAALQTIIDIMVDTAVKDELKLKAAQDILDRAIGKAKQTVDNEVKGGIHIKLSPALEEYSE